MFSPLSHMGQTQLCFSMEKVQSANRGEQCPSPWLCDRGCSVRDTAKVSSVVARPGGWHVVTGGWSAGCGASCPGHGAHPFHTLGAELLASWTSRRGCRRCSVESAAQRQREAALAETWVSSTLESDVCRSQMFMDILGLLLKEAGENLDPHRCWQESSDA